MPAPGPAQPIVVALPAAPEVSACTVYGFTQATGRRPLEYVAKQMLEQIERHIDDVAGVVNELVVGTQGRPPCRVGTA